MRLETIIWRHYGKSIILLLVLTVFLQGYHILYMLKLPEHPASDPRSIRRYIDEQPNILRTDLLQYIKHIERAHKMDYSGTYMFIPNIVTPHSPDDNENLTICSQSTVNNLHYLKNMSQTWDGPISVTVFTHGYDTVFALHTIAYMHACFETVKHSVSFHIAYPILHPPSNIKTILNMDMHCNNVESLLTDKSKVNYGDQIPYPHNILRNIAIEYSSTPYILMIDIDMVPSYDLNRLFQQFIRRRSISAGIGNNSKDQKMVYVIPAFESRTHIGRCDKESLLKEWDLNNIRPFYEHVCWKCQKVTEYEKWRGLPGLHFLDIGYILQWENPWEPFYIAKKQDLPLYDGRFKQYGFNRISQVSCIGQAGFEHSTHSPMESMSSNKLRSYKFEDLYANV